MCCLNRDVVEHHVASFLNAAGQCSLHEAFPSGVRKPMISSTRAVAHELLAIAQREDWQWVTRWIDPHVFNYRSLKLVCNSGALGLVQWVRQFLQLSDSQILELIKHSTRPIAEWLLNNHFFTPSQKLLRAKLVLAIAHEDLALLGELVDGHPFQPSRKMLTQAIRLGKAKTVRWLFDKKQQPNSLCWRLSCEQPCWDVLKILATLPKTGWRASDLLQLCQTRDLDMFRFVFRSMLPRIRQWRFSKFVRFLQVDSTVVFDCLKDAGVWGVIVYLSRCDINHVSVLKWFYDHSSMNERLQNLCNMQLSAMDLEFVQQLFERTVVREPTICYELLVRAVVQSGSWVLLDWLKDKIGITQLEGWIRSKGNSAQSLRWLMREQVDQEMTEEGPASDAFLKWLGPHVSDWHISWWFLKEQSKSLNHKLLLTWLINLPVDNFWEYGSLGRLLARGGPNEILDWALEHNHVFMWEVYLNALRQGNDSIVKHYRPDWLNPRLLSRYWPNALLSGNMQLITWLSERYTMHTDPDFLTENVLINQWLETTQKDEYDTCAAQ